LPIKHADIVKRYKSTENKMNWAYCKNGLQKKDEKNNRVEANCGEELKTVD
jgi:hypothetical protein